MSSLVTTLNSSTARESVSWVTSHDCRRVRSHRRHDSTVELSRVVTVVLFTPVTERPCGADFHTFSLWGHTADVITCVKFQIDRSKGFGLLVPGKIGCFPLTLIVALTTVLRTTVLRCENAASCGRML